MWQDGIERRKFIRVLLSIWCDYWDSIMQILAVAHLIYTGCRHRDKKTSPWKSSYFFFAGCVLFKNKKVCFIAMNHMCPFYNILGQTGGRPVNREYPLSDVQYMDTFVSGSQFRVWHCSSPSGEGLWDGRVSKEVVQSRLIGSLTSLLLLRLPGLQSALLLSFSLVSVDSWFPTMLSLSFSCYLWSLNQSWWFCSPSLCCSKRPKFKVLEMSWIYN